MATFEQKLQLLYKYPEFLDVMEIVIEGAKKHEDEGWLKPDGNTMGIRRNSDSMFHHLADFRSYIDEDHDSGLPPELHLACRALMAYTRRKRMIVHTDDLPELRKKIFAEVIGEDNDPESR